MDIKGSQYARKYLKGNVTHRSQGLLFTVNCLLVGEIALARQGARPHKRVAENGSFKERSAEYKYKPLGKCCAAQHDASVACKLL